MNPSCDHDWQTVYLAHWATDRLDAGAYVGETRRCIHCGRFDDSPVRMMTHHPIVDDRKETP